MSKMTSKMTEERVLTERERELHAIMSERPLGATAPTLRHRFRWRRTPRLRIVDGRNAPARVRNAEGVDVTNAYQCTCGARFSVRTYGRTGARAMAVMCEATDRA